MIISSPGPSSNNVTKGATIEIPITVENRGSTTVKGYVAVVITSNDTSFSADDVSILLKSTNFAGYTQAKFYLYETLDNGYVYKTSTEFVFNPVSREEATLYITFNKENTSPDGCYAIRVMIISG